jgi:CheY-like chemotaxis protein
MNGNDKMEPPTVLVVDDDEDTCKNLQDILDDLGYQTAIAHNGPAALELVKQRHFDVALLDLKMPGMNGLELYRAIRQLRAHTVAIIVTAYAGAGVAEEALAAGAWQVVPKPVDFPRLLGLMGQVLDQPLVLVVDDDPDLCHSLWDLLRERGYRVALAHDEPTAARLLRDSTFRAVLIDMRLPAGDGTSVFRLVRQANPQARTVVITGHRAELEQTVQKVVEEGADAVCYKPFDVGRLLNTLDRLTQEAP